MNKKFVLPVVCLFALAGSASFSLLNRPSYVPTKGYSTSSLPTTIDLNDCTSSEVRNYYSNLNSLQESERTGTNLLKNLKTILKTGQTYYSYDSGSAIWQIYEITDRDWEKSPASSTTYGTYDPSTNKITNYQYGSNSEPKNNPYIHALYINRNVDNQTRAWGAHTQTQWGFQREHVWPKAQGFEAKASGSTGGARGDPMHLMAGNGYVNNIHGDVFYGIVDKSSKDKISTDCGIKYDYTRGNYLGVSKTLGSGTVFEPQDSDKGDIARAIFYMAARYNYLSGSDPDGIDSNNPNLELVNQVLNVSAYTSSTTQTGKMGLVFDLLFWNKIDPVDEYEIHRNNLLYKNYTHNRNPFIDFPDWADCIWGTSQGVKFANPTMDRLNGNGITVSSSSVTIEPNKTTEVTATIKGTGQITWAVADDTVISLSKNSTSSGEAVTITALKEGETTITLTATIDDEEVTNVIKVIVAKKAFVFGLSTPYIIVIGVVAGLIIIGVVIFFFLPNSRAKRRISKQVQKTVKDATKGSSSSSTKKKKKK